MNRSCGAHVPQYSKTRQLSGFLGPRRSCSGCGSLKRGFSDSRHSREACRAEPERSQVAEKQSQKTNIVTESEAGRLKTEGQPSGGLPSAAELSLFLVAAFWGTNPVCLRYIYLLDHAPSPAALAAIQACGAALVLTTLAAGNAVTAWNSSEPYRSLSEPPESPGTGSQVDELLSPATMAGVETGLWTFLANSATISAFQHTPASRGAFLIRLTAVFTPAVARLSGQYVSSKEWTACAIALAGGLLISLDSLLSSDSAAKDAGLGWGDAVMVLSACLWALQTVRIGHHAKQHDQLNLAQTQTITLALLSSLWLAGTTLLEGPSQSAMGSLFSMDTGLLVWTAVLWPAVGPWGIATALQFKAQKTVSASRTQIILATDPLWASGFARLLGSAEQSLGLVGWAGAAGILAASIVSRH